MKLLGPLLLCVFVPFICAAKTCQPDPAGPISILETDGPERGPLFTFIGYMITTHVRVVSDNSKNDLNKKFVTNKTGSVMTIALSSPVSLNDVTDLINGDLGLHLEISVFCQALQFGEEIKSYLEVFVRPNLDLERKTKKYIYRGLDTFLVDEDTDVGEQFVSIGGLITTDDNTRYYEIKTYLASVYVDEWPDALQAFRIGKDGNVFLLKSLSYHGGDREFTFNLTVIGEHDRRASIIIYFEVVNVNNYSPGFDYSGCEDSCKTTHYSAEIQPSHVGPVTSFIIGPMKAVDHDNEPFFYEIVGGSPENYIDYVFLNNATGEVSVLKPVGELNQGIIDMIIRVTTIGDLPEGRQPVRKSAFSICMLWISGFTVDYTLKSATNAAAYLKPSLLSLAAQSVFVVAFASRMWPFF